MDISPLADRVNLTIGLITAIMSYILGEHWVLFVAFLVLNVTDYITGCMKARYNHISNSNKGAEGALKKLGYWIMILVAFLMSAIFIEIGAVIHVNLEITSMIGWFVLATLIINEFRSIIENLVETGYWVPDILKRGLEVADKIVDKAGGTIGDDDADD